MTRRLALAAAVLLSGCSLVANPSGLPAPGTPAAPLGAAARPGNGQASITWDDPGGDVVRYEVHQGTSSGVLSKVADVVDPSYVATGLSNGTTYYFAVAAVDSAGTASPLSPETSATPLGMPTVSLTSPVNGGVNVAVDAPVVVTFSHAMRAETVTVTATPTLDLGPPEWDDASTFVSFLTTFAAETSYAIQVSGADPAGNLTSISFSFSTVAVAPTLDATTPVPDATLVPTAALIQLVFSEPMDQASVELATTVHPTIGCRWEWIGGGNTATCRHTGLAAATLYTVDVSTGARDASALHTHMAGPRQFQFTTAAVPHTLAPTITASTPADGAIGVSRYGAISITFNEAVDVATAQGAFEISPPTARGGTYGWSNAGKTMTYYLPTALDYGVTVSWTMGTGLKCLGDIPMAAAVTRTYRAIRQATVRLYPDYARSGYMSSISTSPSFVSYVFAGDGSANQYYRSFLTFSLGSISDLTYVNSATLTVYQYGVTGDPYGALGPSLWAQSVDFGPDLTQSDFETPVKTYTITRCNRFTGECTTNTYDDEVALITSNPAANPYSAAVTSKVERDRQRAATQSYRVQFRLKFRTNTNSNSNYEYTQLGMGAAYNPPYLDVTYEHP